MAAAEARVGTPTSPRSFPLPLTLMVAAFCVWAWIDRFVQDDAFIAFRYALRFATGEGLTWNPGERVEGYTNFLWTLLIAAAVRLGADPVIASWTLGILFFAGTLTLTWALASELGSRDAAPLAVVLLGANYTFRAYATGGLETQMQVFLVMATALLTLRMWRAPRATTALALSVAAGAAVLTRLDSVVLIGPFFAIAVLAVLRSNRSFAGRALLVLALAGPAGLFGGAWVAWKLSFYGDLLPNTFYAKRGFSGSLKRGIFFIYTFVTTYWLAPFLALLVVGPRDARRGFDWRTLFLLAVCGLWILYVMRVGGDFMEFRFLVVILPFVFLLLARRIQALPRAARFAAVVVLLVGSVLHGNAFFGGSEIESVRSLYSHMLPSGDNWPAVGRALKRAFPGHDQPVMIATSAAGAIAYYSELPTVDMLGLTDRRVAREGVFRGGRAGHEIAARFEYLLERGVNLVLGQPRLEDEAPLPAWYPPEEVHGFRLPDVDLARVPRDARVVSLPYAPGKRIRMLYLVPHPAIDAAIADGRVQSAPIVWPEAGPR